MQFLRTVAFISLLGACSPSPEPITAGTPLTTVPAADTTTLEPLVECPAIGYHVPGLPVRVVGEAADMAQIEEDEFTALGGTRSVFWVDEEGSLTVALIRGALPPRQWPGEKGEIDIAGQPAVVGPFEEGMWVAGWFEGDGQDRCDRYTMVFYPPIEPGEVEAALESMTKNS